ncbi:MAG: hypothetical protein AB8H86_12960 [Polyangiales bacterium]
MAERFGLTRVVMGRGPEKRSRYSDLLVLVAFALGLLLYVIGQFEDYTWIVRDGRFYVNSNITLLENLSYEDIFARSWYEERLGWNYNLPAGFSNVALGSRGELYHFRPWLLPLLSSPLFFAFGLYGVLAFNLLTYAAIMGFGFLYAARFAGRRSAAVATALWVLGTGMVETVYDYSVDALLVAFFLAALELLRRKRGALAGACIAATLVIKPTSLLYAPAAAALLFELPKGQRKAVLLRAIGGGAIALMIAGAINTYMYGAPWVFGYNRVVEVAGGEIQLASTGARFNTPLSDGLIRTFGGGYGLLSFYGVYAAFIFGIWPMLRRHFRFALVALGSAAGVLVVFSLYDWESDRFQYASFALLLPFLAWGLRVVAQFIVALSTRLLRRRIETVAALAAIAAFSMSLSFAGRDGRAHPWREQVPIHELRQLVIPAHESEAVGLVAESGSLALGTDGSASAGTRQSSLTMGRSGISLPRGNLVVVGVSALASHIHLLMLLNALLAAFGFAFLASATRGLASPSARLAFLAVALTLHPVREMVAFGGDSLFAFVPLAAGLWALRTRRSSLAFGLGILAAFFLAAPIVALAFALPLALDIRDKPETARKKLFAAALSVGVWATYGLIVYGRPFEGPESFVLIGGERFAITPDASALSALLSQPHPARAAFAFALAGACGSLLLCFGHHRRVGLCATLIALGFLFPSGHPHGGLESSFVAVLAPFALYAAGRLLPALATLWTPKKRRQRALALITTAMLLWGAGWRVAEANGPLNLASSAGVRNASVRLAELPCDFLAWENMSWECAMHDGGTDGRTGLQLPDGSRVNGERRSLFVVPTGRGGRRARVVDFAAPAGRASLRWVIPDGYRGGATVTISWGDTLLREDDIHPGDEERREDFVLSGEGPLRIRVQASTRGEWSAVGFSGQLE